MGNRQIQYAYIETTTYCNLKCSFCNREEVINGLQHMTLDDFDKVLAKLEGQPIKEAKLMGMGEPFLHPQFDEICKRFKEAFPDAYVIVATNCQYRIKENFTEALKYIDELYFSIDGYQDNYEKDRAPAKWSKLITFLDEFSEVDRHDCKVVCNYVVNPSNINDIPFVDKHIIQRYDLKELRLNIAQDWNENQEALIEYTDEQIQFLKDHYRANVKGRSVWDFSDCFWVQNGIYMTVEGNVKVCCMNTSAQVFGNLFQQSVDTIFSNLEYQAIKTGCETNNPTDHCKNCSYKQLTPILEKIL